MESGLPQMIDNEDDWDSEDYEEGVWDLADYEDRYNELVSEREAAREERERDSYWVDVAEAQETLSKYCSLQKKLIQPLYDAFCWQEHHEPLTSKTHRRCRQGCGWLRCDCGSCWCDMPDEKKAKYRVWPQYVDGASICTKCKAHPVNKTKAGAFIRCSECGGKGYRLQQ